MRDCLNDILNENLLLTLAPLNREPTIHDPTVARAFERMLLRKKLVSETEKRNEKLAKLVRAFPAEKNRPHVIQRRAGCTNLFIRYAVVNHSFFVDECGYNIWTARSHGRAVRGKRAYRQVCGQRGRNVTITMAISPTNDHIFHSGILGGMILRGLTTFCSRPGTTWTLMNMWFLFTMAHQPSATLRTPVRTASLRCSRRTAANKLVSKLFVEMKFYFLVLNSIRCTSVLLVWNIIYSKIGIADQSNEFSGFPAFQNTVGKAPKVWPRRNAGHFPPVPLSFPFLPNTFRQQLRRLQADGLDKTFLCSC